MGALCVCVLVFCRVPCRMHICNTLTPKIRCYICDVALKIPEVCVHLMYAHLTHPFIYVGLAILIVGMNFNCFAKQSSIIYIYIYIYIYIDTCWV